MTQTQPKPNPDKFKTDSLSNGHPLDSEKLPLPPPPPPPQSREKDASKLGIQVMPNIPEFLEEPIASQAQSYKLRTWRRGRPWGSLTLQAKATAISLVMVLLSTGVAGTLTYFSAGNSLEEDIKHLEEDNTRAIADKVAFFLRERYGDIQVAASLDFVRDPNALRNSLRPDEQARKLDEFLNAYDVYDSIAIFDQNGNLLIQTLSRGTSLVKNQLDESYFQTVLETNQPFISQPFIASESNRFSIYIAAPITSPTTGQIVGVARARMPVRFMEEVLASQRQGDEGDQRTLYLVDEGGNIFASSQELGELGTGEDIPANSLIPNYRALQGGDVRTQVAGEFVESYVPLTSVGGARGDLPDLGWSTISTVPKSIAFAPKLDFVVSLLGGTVLAILVVGVLVILIVSRAARPIVEAAQTVALIGQGDLSARLPVKGEDEIAQLGGNINSMAEQIDTLLQEQAIAAEQARFLAEVAATPVGGRPNLTPFFNKALNGARELLSLDRLMLYTVAAGEGTIAAESVANGQLTAASWNGALPKLSTDLMARYQAGEVIPISDTGRSQWSEAQKKWLAALKVKASVEAPMITEGQLSGLLLAHDCQGERQWKAQEINFLRQLASQLETATNRVNSLEQIQRAQQEAEKLAAEQTELKESLQRRALELLMEVDPVSRGDLTIRAKVTEDEIGTVADSYNATIESLRKIVGQVQQAAGQVTLTAGTSETAVETLSSAATIQTKEIEVALQRIQQMATSIQMVSVNAEQAETAVQQANQTVQEGDAAMNRTVDGILAIRETVGETAKKVKRLGESSQKISKVVNLISTFAAQTNLLALNASIEAARAGEEGRGFAVVADEVRSLARQSAEATAEIEKLVAGIQAETQEVVAAMESGTEQVVAGTQLVDETRQSLNRISDASTQISQLVDAISKAATEQASSSEAVTQTMTSLANIATQTSTEAEQVSDSFRQLVSVAQALQSEVARFKVG